MKRLLAIIGCAILLALVCIQLYSRFLNPDMKFFLHVAETSDRWAEQIHADERHVYVLAGGSEARSGVDPQIMLDEFELPLINAAEGAGHGLRANANVAFQYLKPGDTLILSILSTHDVNVSPSAAGMKLNVYRMGTRVLKTGMIGPSLENAGKFLASDMRNMFIMLTRYFGRQGRLFKYDEQTLIHSSGWMEIQYREMDKYKPTPLEEHTSIQPLADDSEFMDTLRQLGKYCQERNIRLLTNIPVGCNHESYRPQYAMQALCITRLGIPVLKDERLGCLPVPTNFADTPAHLNTEAVAENTRIIARLLQKNSFWTEQELVDCLHSAGYQPDGKPQQ